MTGDTICTARSEASSGPRPEKRSRERTYAAGIAASSVTAVAVIATTALFHRYHGTCVCVSAKR